MSKLPPILGALPKCCVVDCSEMASPRGGLQSTTLTLTGNGLSLRVEAWIFTCAKHSEEFGRIVQGEERPS